MKYILIILCSFIFNISFAQSNAASDDLTSFGPFKFGEEKSTYEDLLYLRPKWSKDKKQYFYEYDTKGSTSVYGILFQSVNLGFYVDDLDAEKEKLATISYCIIDDEDEPDLYTSLYNSLVDKMESSLGKSESGSKFIEADKLISCNVWEWKSAKMTLLRYKKEETSEICRDNRINLLIESKVR